jgi:hypothetical protein
LILLKVLKIKTLLWDHRVGRVVSFSPVVGIGTPPSPRPQASVSLPSFGSEGRDILTVVVYICTYFVFVILKIVPKSGPSVHWSKSTIEKEGKLEQKFDDAAFGTIFRIRKCFQRSNQKLYIYFSL